MPVEIVSIVEKLPDLVTDAGLYVLLHFILTNLTNNHINIFLDL